MPEVRKHMEVTGEYYQKRKALEKEGIREREALEKERH
jgi:hypothetical protein